jgi:Raf kinase inhibitor-like YbhB/YbcL family protein
MRLAFAVVILALIAGCGRAATHAGPRAVTVDVIAARSAEPLKVTSSALGAGGAFSPRNTAYGENRSLPLSWAPVAAAGAYAVVIEDPDAPSPAPFVHWVIWNIPGSANALPEGLPNVGGLASPKGAVQGSNGAGELGYHGPQPPAGTGLHHYHIQLFALDGPLPLQAGADLGVLRQAMKDHVLAKGELIGTCAAP